MGHAIATTSFNPKKGGGVPLKEMLRDASEFAAENVDRCENPSGSYHGNFGELSAAVFKSRREAERFMDGCIGNYRDGYVRYLADKETSALKKAKERYLALCRERREFLEKSGEDVLNRKSAFIGCPKCASKVSRIYLKKAACPVCGEDLRNETAKKRLLKFDERIESAKAAVEKEEGGGRLMYLAKYEVHC